ncbi:MAG: crotonase/enoyl-CoA hydratase family protein, partial [Acidobacteriota bacterium]|nr:crotonase/enoyl-CoA hydratase family protein [Acidobacteriota bacterium]
MDTLKTLTYDVTGRIARITLNRPERGNGITFEMPAELAACVERANLDPGVHVIALSGNGKGFCGGYDLIMTAEQRLGVEGELMSWPQGSPMDPKVQLANHDPEEIWDPILDYSMMSRNVRGFMSLFYSDKPVICKVHGFCVAGGTDMALCSDLLFIEDTATIGYPPARAWGVPTTALWAHRIGAEKAKRLLFTGDCLTGKQAVEWGLATEATTADKLDQRFERMLERVA